MTDMRFDWDRQTRTGVAEAALAEGKGDTQIRDLVAVALAREHPLLITRLDTARGPALAAEFTGRFEYDKTSHTAIAGAAPKTAPLTDALIVTGGTSDMTVAAEAQRTLAFHGHSVDILADCGVAGLWRLTEHAERLRTTTTLIAVAGMEGALFPVIAGPDPRNRHRGAHLQRLRRRRKRQGGPLNRAGHLFPRCGHRQHRQWVWCGGGVVEDAGGGHLNWLPLSISPMNNTPGALSETAGPCRHHRRYRHDGHRSDMKHPGHPRAKPD